MKNLDERKVYYLGDLSDEQKYKLEEITYNNSIQKHKYDYLLEFTGGRWKLTKEVQQHKPTNALTLFEQDSNQRIIEIQLRMQELNSEILELDYELRELTYAKK